MRCRSYPRRVFGFCQSAFTLVEILVSITILLLLMVVLFQLTATLGKVWTSSRGRTSAFENARFAFSTLTSTLSRATLNTYTDYYGTDKTGSKVYRNSTNASTFVPTQFARASELHFFSGPANVAMGIVRATGDTYQPWPVTPGTTTTTPGHAIFFQAPLGVTTNANATKFAGLNQTLNSVGFYVQYGSPPNSMFPSWLQNTGPSKDYRFRLLEYVEPTENMYTYISTSYPTYDSVWTTFGAMVSDYTKSYPNKPRARILAEDVLLLVLRPRVSVTDEQIIAPKVGAGPYDAAKAGSYLCPNYHYDSRAWMSGYPTNRVPIATRASLMTNQVPPIIDVVMICADPQSIARIGTTSAAAPDKKRLPTASVMGLFADSSLMESDLKDYSATLSGLNINFHIMRSSVQIQSSRWANN